MRFLLAAATIGALLLVTATACDPGEDVRVENRSGEPVMVYENNRNHQDVFMGTVGPGETGAFSVAPLTGPITYEVKARNGDLLGTKTFTWEEIDEANGFTIVVR